MVRHKRWLICTSLVVILLGWWFLHRKPSLADDAEVAFNLAVAGKGGELYDYLLPTSIEDGNWSRAKYATFIKELVAPKYVGCSNFETAKKYFTGMPGGQPVQGVAVSDCIKADGTRISLSAVTEVTDNGGKIGAIEFLYGAWIDGYRIANNKKSIAPREKIQAMIDGYERDKETIAKLGIESLGSEVPGKPLSFAKVMEFWKDYLKKQPTK